MSNITKKLSLLVLFIFSLGLFATAVKAEPSSDRLKDSIILFIGNPKAYVNNSPTNVDKSNPDLYPFVKDGRTLVPVRFIAENFGAYVDWDNSTKTATLMFDGGKTVKMTIDNKTILINGKEEQIDVPPQIIKEKTFLPLRALVDIVEKELFWDNRGLIIISSNKFDASADKSLIDDIINSYFSKSKKKQTENNTTFNSASGYISLKDDYVYKIDSNVLYVGKLGSPEMQKINKVNVDQIFVNDKYLYYNSSDSPNFGLSRIDLNGTGYSKVASVFKGKILNITDSWIFYYSSDNTGNYIYKMSTAGTNTTQVSKYNALYPQYSNGNIYFINEDIDKTKNDWMITGPKYHLMKYNLESEETVMLLNNIKPQEFMVAGDRLLYIIDKKQGAQNDNTLYSCSLGGQNSTKIADNVSKLLRFIDNKLYFIPYENNLYYLKINSMNIDGSNSSLFYEDESKSQTLWFELVNKDYIYSLVHPGHKYITSIKDGSRIAMKMND